MRLEETVSYETILLVTEKDESAIEEVVSHFKNQIYNLSVKKIKNMDGSSDYYIDYDRVLQLQTKLMLSIMKFQILPEQEEE